MIWIILTGFAQKSYNSLKSSLLFESISDILPINSKTDKIEWFRTQKAAHLKEKYLWFKFVEIFSVYFILGFHF